MSLKNNEEQKYLIPKRLLKKNTIFTGIGGKELLIIGFGLITGVLLYLIFSNLMFLFKLLLLVAPPFFAYMLVAPLQYGENALVIFKRWRTYHKNPKIYYYSRNKGV